MLKKQDLVCKPRYERKDRHPTNFLHARDRIDTPGKVPLNEQLNLRSQSSLEMTAILLQLASQHDLQKRSKFRYRTSSYRLNSDKSLAGY